MILSMNCSVKNCLNIVLCKMVCNKHYLQIKKYGEAQTENRTGKYPRTEKHIEQCRKARAASPGSSGKRWKLDSKKIRYGLVPKSAFRHGYVPWNKGLKNWISDEHKQALKVANAGRPAWNKGLYGINTGEKNPNWKGGKNSIHQALRRTSRYAAWRTAIFERDDYTCQNCYARGVMLNADHIKQFAFYPELRFELSNGRTLCVPCHELTPTYKNHQKVEV